MKANYLNNSSMLCAPTGESGGGGLIIPCCEATFTRGEEFSWDGRCGSAAGGLNVGDASWPFSESSDCEEIMISFCVDGGSAE